MIFGTGDLTHRKLMPPYNMLRWLSARDLRWCLSVGEIRLTMNIMKYASIDRHSRNKVDEDIWTRLKDMIKYRFDFRIMMVILN